MRILVATAAALLAMVPAAGRAQAPAPPPTKGGRGSASPDGQTAADGFRRVPLRDPVLGMDAFVVTIPPDWHVRGAVIYGTQCNQVPFPVFRANSPDGLTTLERLPRLDWWWGSFSPQGPQRGCLPLKEEISASDFLRQLSALLQVEYVAEVPLPPMQVQLVKKFNADADAASEQFSQTHRGYDASHEEIALAKARYQNGTFPMEALLSARLICHRHSSPGPRQEIWSERCEANVRIIRAPTGKLDATSRALDGAGAWMLPAWDQAYQAMVAQRAQMQAQQMSQLNAAQMQAQNDQFNRSMALQQQQHEQFLGTLAGKQAMHEQQLNVTARGTAMSMAQSAQASAARHTVASDWVDSALGQQTVRDPTTGQVSKVSGAYGNTWINETGKNSFQTPDPNADPNGHLQGTWTLQQQVHGDGTTR